MSKTYTHTTWVEIANKEVKLVIGFTVSPIIPASGPTYASGGETESGGEIEIVSAELHDAGGLPPFEAPGWLTDILREDEDLKERLFEGCRDEIYGEDEDYADRRYDEMRDEQVAA